MEPATIFAALIFGSIGMAYIVYGRKQRRGMALLSGVALCAYPYFISNILAIVIIGLALMAVPFFVKY
jgi:branched-subunit amino acid transport protein